MFERQLLAKIYPTISTREILVLLGARQVGKTTLLLMLKERLLKEKKALPEQIHFFDLESLADRQFWSDEILVEKRLLQENSTRYIFIDEFQKVPALTSSLKYFHDHYPKIKFILSGSSSIAIQQALSESLLGRKRTFVLFPLSFEEYLTFRRDQKNLSLYRQLTKNNSLTEAEKEMVNLALRDFLTFGGYPKIVLTPNLEEKKNLLLEQINTYLLKDIQLLLKTNHLPAFEKTLSLLASFDAGLINTNQLAQKLGLHYQTVSRYLFLLKHTYLLNTLKAFSTHKATELRKMEKGYFLDLGLKNALRQNFELPLNSPSFGLIAENFVVNELLKNKKPLQRLFYWRTKQGQEVDVVLKEENRIVPLEVKTASKKTIPSGLKSFINQYHPAKAYVLNHDFSGKKVFAKCQIHFLPLFAAGLVPKYNFL